MAHTRWDPVARTRAGTALARLLTTGVVVLALTGCGGVTGDFNPSIGTSARSTTIEALGFAVVTNDRGSARMVGTLLNTSQKVDHLRTVKVEASHGPPIRVTLSDKPVVLKPSTPVRLAKRALVNLSAKAFPVGRLVRVTLGFRRGEHLTWHVPVEPQGGPYAEIDVTSPPDGTVAPGR